MGQALERHSIAKISGGSYYLQPNPRWHLQKRETLSKARAVLRAAEMARAGLEIWGRLDLSNFVTTRSSSSFRPRANH